MNPKIQNRLRALRAELEAELQSTSTTSPRSADTADDEPRLYPALVAGQSGEDVVVELSPLVQGVVSRTEFDQVPAPGTRLNVSLVGREDELWLFSVQDARRLAAWDEIEVGSLVKALVIGLNKGGLECKVGPVRAFMPASQVALEHVEDLAAYANQTLVCAVLEVDRAKKRVVLSRRAVLEREKKAQREHSLGGFAVGAVVRGRVSRLESYGAFIDIGGVEGLLHVSNLAHRRVERPDELLAPGQTIEVQILSIEEGGKRIGLGRKQLEADPWDGVEERLREGALVTGSVRRVTNFGAFLELEPGVEGLLHVSQFGGTRLRNPGEGLAPGTVVPVRILSIDPKARRISLSRLASDGSVIGSTDAAETAEVHEIIDQGRTLQTNLGALFKKALEKR